MRGSSYANFNRWNVSCSPKVSRTTDRTRVERENGHQNLPCGAADRFPERPLSCWKTSRFQRGDLGLTESPSTPRTASFESELQISDARGVRAVVRFGPYRGNAPALEERQATEVPHHGPAMAERSEELVEQRQIAAPELVRLEIAAGGQHVVENGPVEPSPIAKGDRHAERVGVIVELPERQRGADPAVQSFDGIKRVQARMSAEIKHAACDSQLVGRGERQRDRDALDVIAAEWTRARRACE